MVDDAELLALADVVSANAYARYSGFAVGAVVVTEAGTRYTGCNVENMAYPLGTCAERVALGAAITADGPAVRIAAIAIAARQAGARQPCAPCGGCRQVIAELAPTARVLFIGADGQPIATTAQDLLPHAFSFTPS
jgi:cytidine deaminase